MAPPSAPQVEQLFGLGLRPRGECSPCLREFGIEQEVKALVARCCGSELAPAELKDRLRLKLSELVVNAEGRELRPD